MAKRKKTEPTWCYRTDCNCLDPAVYSEFDTEEEAEEHIRKDHPNSPMMFIVPMERKDCQHPRHTQKIALNERQTGLIAERLSKVDRAAKRKAFEKQRQAVKSANQKLNKMIDNCPHVMVKHGELAVCDICGKDFGWWCPKSGDRRCHYEGDEWCVHCGEPNERK